jgi:PfaD family protein
VDVSVRAANTAPALRWMPGERVGLVEGVRRFREPVHIVQSRAGHEPGIGFGGRLLTRESAAEPGDELLGTLPPLYPEWLGDRSFNRTHGVRFPYVAGEMANGIATVAGVVAMARAQMLGFFGAAGLALPVVEGAVEELRRSLPDRDNWGVNLIHSPTEPGHEERLVDLLVRAGVPRISASAYMELTPAVVRCAVAGLRPDRSADGGIARARHLFAKVSRPEVAAKFLSPAPPEILRRLVESGQITPDEAGLAARLPLAEDVTVEADSGGHTDNRPLAVILPVIRALRDELSRRHRYPRPIRIGAAGGLGDPAGVAAAFAAGAAYVVTGTINQLSLEAGLSDAAKGLLAQADLADVAMAPAADMFEYGIKVQVLRRGTLFAARAGQLYETYLAYPSLADIPDATRERLEKDILRATFEDCWEQCRRFWLDRDPREVDRAEQDPRHRMALVFRSYLGLSSRWAITGEPDRQTDFQIWCGPAIGAFNRWAAGSPLARPAQRTVVQIALNLLEGAAVVTRAHQLRSYGVPVPAEAFAPRPRLLS